jgi:hypothetical protein
LASPILFSQVVVASLCSNKVSFIPIVVIWKYDYSHAWKKVVNKLSFVWCWR